MGLEAERNFSNSSAHLSFLCSYFFHRQQPFPIRATYSCFSRSTYESPEINSSTNQTPLATLSPQTSYSFRTTVLLHSKPFSYLAFSFKFLFFKHFDSISSRYSSERSRLFHAAIAFTQPVHCLVAGSRSDSSRDIRHERCALITLCYT